MFYNSMTHLKEHLSRIIKWHAPKVETLLTPAHNTQHKKIYKNKSNVYILENFQLLIQFVIDKSYSSNKDKLPSKKERKKERKKEKRGEALGTPTSPTQNSLFNNRRWLSRGMTFRI